MDRGPVANLEPMWVTEASIAMTSPMPKDWADDQSRSVVIPLRWIEMVFICPPRLAEPARSELLVNISSGSQSVATGRSQRSTR